MTQHQLCGGRLTLTPVPSPGYERDLPGFPRYRIVGDADAGVSDLEVSNVTLDDDALFQCQVSPNEGQQAIRAVAYLTVLCE